MALFSRLFGGGGGGKPATVDAIDYEGFRIIPDPIAEEGQFRLAARIEMDIDGETKSHHLIRADVIRNRGEAVDAAIRKARQMIDQQGQRLFG